MIDSPKESIKKFSNELQSHGMHLPHYHHLNAKQQNRDSTSSNTSNNSGNAKRKSGSPAISQGNTPLNLAQQYEQDKQKLIRYCFSRYDPDGTLHESYITHVRIVEDSRYPSSRPPPNSLGSHKKERIISLAVKRSGTVRVHKGRENANGSFQIGRTWNLDELTEVELDTLVDKGLIIHLGKPYYWETNTSKERTVFIKSLCNIYKKFTKGGMPVLVNFDKNTFGDIIAMGNHGKSVTLRFSEGEPANVSEPMQINTKTNSTYSKTNANIFSPITPINGNTPVSPIGVRDNSYLPLNDRISTHESPMQLPNSKKPTTQDSKSILKTAIMGSTAQQNIENLNEISYNKNLAQNSEMIDSGSQRQLNNLPSSVPTQSNRKSVLGIEFKVTSPKNRGFEEQKNFYNDENNNADKYNSEELDKSTFSSKLNLSSMDDLSTPSAKAIDSMRDRKDTFTADSDVGEDVDLVSQYNDTNIETKAIFNNNFIEKPSKISRGGLADSVEDLDEDDIDNTPLEELFEEIEWNSRDNSKDISLKLMRSLLKTEYESVNSLINISSSFGEIDKYIEKSISQCDKLDPMLTFFQVELDGFNDEISYIEKQENGLQVTTANKKALWKNLKDIISNVSLNKDELQLLSDYTISSNEREIRAAEGVLNSLYSAFQTINGIDRNNLGNIKALTERYSTYVNYSDRFIKGLNYFLTQEFQKMAHIMDELMRQAINNMNVTKTFNGSSLMRSINQNFSDLLIYSGFTLYAKEISEDRFYAIIGIYQDYLKSSTNGIFENFLNYNEKVISAILSRDDFHYKFLFDYRGNRNNALNNKASKNLTENNTVSILTLDLENSLFDKVCGIIKLLENLIIQQQVFVGDFFHLLSLNDFNLSDFLKLYPTPKDRIITFFNKSQSYIDSKEVTSKESSNDTEFRNDETSSNNNKSNNSTVDVIFSEQIAYVIKFMVDFVTKHTQLAPSLILLIDNSIKRLSSKNNDYVVSAFLEKLFSKFTLIWNHYVKTQVKLVANNLNSNFSVDKKINILFVIKAYPQFVKFTEKSLRIVYNYDTITDDSTTRAMLDSTYESFNSVIMKSFISTLEVIGTSTSKSKKTNDTSAPITVKKKTSAYDYVSAEGLINQCTNLIMNSSYLIDMLENSDNKVISRFRNEIIDKIYRESSRAYIVSIVNSSLGKLLEFLEGFELLQATTRSKIAITKNNTYSKENFKKVLEQNSKQEIQKCIEANYKKIESDFNNLSSESVKIEYEELLILRLREKDFQSLKSRLVDKIWEQTETEYILIHKRISDIKSKYYKDVDVDVTRNNLVDMFKSVARAGKYS